MKKVIFFIIIAAGICIPSESVFAETVLLHDDFESYSINTWPSPDWTAVWNATDTSTNKITYDPTDPTNQVLKLYGKQNWSAGARQFFSFTDAFHISAKIYNGSEPRTPGGWGRGAIGLHDVRTLFVFRSDGTYDAAGAGGYGVLGTYETERWYDLDIDYIRNGTNLTMTIWLDGNKVLDTSFVIDSLEAEATSHYLVINGGCTAYFDDINVYTGGESPVEKIMTVIADKLNLVEQINTALDKEQEVYDALDEMLVSGDYSGLTHGDIVKARQKIHSAMQHQEQAKEDLEKSIEKLADALESLGSPLEP